MSDTPRTDVGVDYWINTGEITELRGISEEMEEELFRANKLIKDCLAAMPVGYIPTHTPENLPSMIGDLAKKLAKETQNSEKLEKELAEAQQHRDEWFEVYTQTLKKLGDAREQIAKLITDA